MNGSGALLVNDIHPVLVVRNVIEIASAIAWQSQGLKRILQIVGIRIHVRRNRDPVAKPVEGVGAMCLGVFPLERMGSM